MKLSVYLLCFFVSFNFYAQKSVNPTPEDIAQANALKNTYPDDEVVILSSKEQIKFGFNKSEELVTVNQSLEEELMNIAPRADIQKYVFYDNASKITHFSTRYRNNKVKLFPVKDEFYESGDIFYNDARVKYMSIDFPVLAYKYRYNLEKKYTDSKYFTSVSLIDEYPMLQKEVSLMVPDWLEVELLEFNFQGYDISKEKKYHEKQKATEYIYTVTKVPSFSKEPNTPGPSHIHPHILVITKSMTINENKTPLFAETQHLYNWYKALVESMEDDPTLLEDLVEELTQNASSAEEKVKNIYYWVQDNIRYIAFEDGIAGFKPDESQNVFKKKYGDCKGMANLTKQMLILAGFDARLTWIGTKRIAYDYSIPSLAVDNHMICTVLIDGKKYFLDSTEKYNSLGEYAERIQGRPVLIENDDKYWLDKIPSASASKNKESTLIDLKIVDENLVGTVNRKFSGESRSHFLYGYNSLKTDKKEDALQYYLTKGDKNREIANVATSDLENRDNEIAVSYDLIVENKVASFDDDIYIDLEFDQPFGDLDLSERKANVEFPYKSNLEFTTLLTIPNGYFISELPDSLETETSDFKVSLSFVKQDNTLVYKKNFVFKNAHITHANFDQWNAVAKTLKNTYKQQVVLIKSQNHTRR